jgi:hypothetical protein
MTEEPVAPPQEPSATPQQPCIACRTPIEAGARICPTCKSWQKSWKNTALFYGSLAGLVALVVTGSAYCLKTLHQSLFTSDDAEVLQWKIPGYQVYTNAGTNDLFLSHIELYWGHGGSMLKVIDKPIKSGEILSVKDHIRSSDGGVFRYVANANGDGSSLVPKARPIGRHTLADQERDRCYLMVFFSEGAPSITLMDRHYRLSNRHLALAKSSEASLFYYTTNGQLRKKNVPIVIAFLDLQRPDCTDRPPQQTPTNSEPWMSIE